MNNENKKCSQYEGLFVFQDDKCLSEHIKNCVDCKNEYNKYLKISSLVKEVAPVYLEKERKKAMMNAVKRLACCFILFIGLTSFAGYKFYDNYTYQLSLEQESTVSEMGLPIDEYGFLSL